MRKILLSLVVLLFVGIGEALPSGGPYPFTGDPLKGRELFFASKGCIKCHSIRGKGGKVGPDLGMGQFERSLTQIAGVMWNHSPKMGEKMREVEIPRPKFTAQEMADIIAFLYYIEYFDEPGDPSEGRRLMKEKGCLRCHSVAGEGGRIGPSLDIMKQYASPIYMAQAMWNHGPQMTAKMEELGIPRPVFQGNEVADFIAYIRAASKERVKKRVYILPGEPQEGKRLFSKKGCIKCHSIKGEGGRIGPDLAEKEMHRSLTRIAGEMWNHGPVMWARMKEIGIPRPVFKGKEMADIIAYLYFLRFSDDPGSANKGKGLFASKGCIKCHSIKGEGGRIGPDLAKSQASISPIYAAQLMWNHAPVMEKRMKEKELPWPKFEGDEMANLLSYLNAMRENK